MFEIKFVNNREVANGYINMNGEMENIDVDLSFWGKDDYVSQWESALDQLVRGQNKTALITSLSDLETANFIIVWPMYRVDNIVYIQNQLLFLDDIRDKFSVEKIYDFISEREPDEEVSEWTVTIEDLQEFLPYIHCSS